MDRPGVFGRLLLESPSLFISNRQLLKSSRAFRQWPARIFMAMGTREAGSERRDQQVVEDVRELEHVLRRAGLRRRPPAGEDRRRRDPQRERVGQAISGSAGVSVWHAQGRALNSAIVPLSRWMLKSALQILHRRSRCAPACGLTLSASPILVSVFRRHALGIALAFWVTLILVGHLDLTAGAEPPKSLWPKEES